MDIKEDLLKIKEEFEKSQLHYRDELADLVFNHTKKSLSRFRLESERYLKFLNEVNCFVTLSHLIDNCKLFYTPEQKSKIITKAIYYCNNKYIKLLYENGEFDVSEIFNQKTNLLQKIDDYKAALTKQNINDFKLEIERTYNSNRIHHVSIRLDWDFDLLFNDTENKYLKFHSPNTREIFAAKHINLRLGFKYNGDVTLVINCDWSTTDNINLCLPYHLYRYEFIGKPLAEEIKKQILTAYMVISEIKIPEAVINSLILKNTGL